MDFYCRISYWDSTALVRLRSSVADLQTPRENKISAGFPRCYFIIPLYVRFFLLEKSKLVLILNDEIPAEKLEVLFQPESSDPVFPFLHYIGNAAQHSRFTNRTAWYYPVDDIVYIPEPDSVCRDKNRSVDNSITVDFFYHAFRHCLCAYP